MGCVAVLGMEPAFRTEPLPSKASAPIHIAPCEVTLQNRYTQGADGSLSTTHSLPLNYPILQLSRPAQQGYVTVVKRMLVQNKIVDGLKRVRDGIS